MNVARMRLLDRWIGVPTCLVLTWLRRLESRPQPATPRKILFVKLAEQGSTVLAHGAVQEAIDRVGRENVYFLLFAENRPILDQLDLVPPRNIISIDAQTPWRALVGALAAIRRMRSEGIDTVIDLEFFARSSAALSFLSGAPWRVGYHAFHGEAGYRGDLMTHRLSFNPYLHTSQAFRLMVQALDQAPAALPRLEIVPPPTEPTLPQFRPQTQEVFEMRRLLADTLGLRPEQRLVLLNANASDLMPLRRWPSERYVVLAQELLVSYPEVRIAFTGAPSEAAAVEHLVRQVGSRRCGSLAGKTTMRELLVLYSLADVLVTNDSGPAHFAALTGIDVVVLFGPETPRLFAAASPRTHPLWAGLGCSPCINAFNDRQSACTDNACMQALSVDQVCAKVCQVYEARQRKPKVVSRPQRQAA